jgi:hypothetical protein
MRLLVCGGRDYTDGATAFALLDRIHAMRPITCVIQGDARGADTLARHWACSHSVPHEDYPADWRTHGKAAGHIRNAQMLAEGRPDKVVAFPGGRGTADMVRKARAAGLNVLELKGGM